MAVYIVRVYFSDAHLKTVIVKLGVVVCKTSRLRQEYSMSVLTCTTVQQREKQVEGTERGKENEKHVQITIANFKGQHTLVRHL